MAQQRPSTRPADARRRARGFSLIELLIVIAIIGILGALAYPSYGEYVRQTRRADGRLALLSAVQAMERCKATRYTYVGCTLDGSSSESPEGYYAIAISAQTASTFSLSATAQNEQAGDTDCATMTLNHLGTEGPAACWD